MNDQEKYIKIFDLFNSAEVFNAAGQFEDCISLYQNWLQENESPLNHLICFNAGVAMESQENFLGAEQMYEQAIVLNPAFFEARFNLGTLHENSGRREEAIKIWQSILIEIPSIAIKQDAYILTLNNLARLLGICEEYERAIDHAVKSLTVDPDQPAVVAFRNKLYLLLEASNNKKFSFSTPTDFVPAIGTQLFFCVAHIEPLFIVPSFITMVGSGNYVPESGIALSRDYPDLAPLNDYLGEFAALFAIARRLKEAEVSGFVGTCHYRRFALVPPAGELRGFQYFAHPSLMRIAKPENFYLDGKTPIIPAMVHFTKSILRSYAATGMARDIMLFFGDAVDCGAITDVEAAEFLSGNSFIAIPTVAYIPVDWYLDIVEKIEKVISIFRKNHHLERQGYHQRNMGFCAERLHGFLLAKHVQAYGWDKIISQPVTRICDSGSCDWSIANIAD